MSMKVQKPYTVCILDLLIGTFFHRALGISIALTTPHSFLIPVGILLL